MRIMAVSMIRNDADIVASFLGHCGALFDRVFAVDHYSSDGTAEMLAAATRKMPLTLRTFRQRDKRQGDILTTLAREAFADGADWVVPHDADEFPEVADRAALEACAGATRTRWYRAASIASRQLGVMRWPPAPRPIRSWRCTGTCSRKCPILPCRMAATG